MSRYRAGVRETLRTGPAGESSVTKRKKVAGVSFEPDLVFGDGLATGDVQYRLHDGYWHRSDLYQTIAFAVAFQTRQAAVINFSPDHSAEPLPAATAGGYHIRHLVWLASPHVTPSDAEFELVRSTRRWLEAFAATHRTATMPPCC